MDRDTKIFVAGHQGMVGSAILRKLKARSYTNTLTNTITVPRDDLDLNDRPAVNRFFARDRIEYVFLAAAKVGGILANATYPADFIRENLLIQTNVVDTAHEHGVRTLMFMGSSCVSILS